MELENCKQMLIKKRGGSKRLYYIDLAKVLATFLVIFSHMYATESPERLYIYAFHMPFFFFVSGMFFKPIPIKEEIKKSFKKLIIPAFIYISIAFLIKVVFFDNPFLELLKGTFWGLITGHQIKANNIAWFFFALANVRILASIWYYKKYLCTLIILVLFSLTVILRTPFFLFAQAIVALPFYLIAYYLKDYINNESSKDRGWIRIIISIILLAGTVILTNINGRADVFGLSFGHLPYGIKFIVFYANAIIGSLLILNTALIFNKPNVIIEKTALALMTTLGFQRIPLNIYCDIFGKYSPYWYSIPGTIIIMAICVICHKPISKLFPK